MLSQAEAERLWRRYKTDFSDCIQLARFFHRSGKLAKSLEMYDTAFTKLSKDLSKTPIRLPDARGTRKPGFHALSMCLQIFRDGDGKFEDFDPKYKVLAETAAEAPEKFCSTPKGQAYIQTDALFTLASVELRRVYSGGSLRNSRTAARLLERVIQVPSHGDEGAEFLQQSARTQLQMLKKGTQQVKIVLGEDGGVNAVLPQPLQSCAQCGKAEETEKLLACGRCMMTKYCSKECQKTHWKAGGHKTVCVPASSGDQGGDSPSSDKKKKVCPPERILKGAEAEEFLKGGLGQLPPGMQTISRDENEKEILMKNLIRETIKFALGEGEMGTAGKPTLSKEEARVEARQVLAKIGAGGLSDDRLRELIK
uniref:MYND-type domain-containing protein n=1 Tax=Chromera velia CCMP2878 TaxID=1169474 RepID=A0A0G4F6X0_9ALVE|eukprot:Cvel_15499.t1-p1 / transcript=Cvel_15499.t1 / gene=Cvel_15499 / organism=Chromera_velia_CCMP2878 / gene_product=hypothetical protein / transcript_product=hypothetical protein / location=Cvel_scaffold1150:14837-15934(+) / protein_length=366 / sequence_SO=supercontig / SO=protein_coding / is_pseudo=false